MRKRNKLLSGVGINDLDYPIVGADGERCPFYETWASMLKRCYSLKFQQRFPSYKDCNVHSDWLYASNFKSWMETQDWEGKQLDKDLLIEGNKMYGPDTSVFISKEINIFMTEKQSHNTLYPGVHFRTDTLKYRAYCSNGKGGVTHLGQYESPEEAYLVYRLHKFKMAEDISLLEKDPRIAEALIKRYKVEEIK